MMTPLVVRLIRRGRLGPTLFLMALATSANIGSVMTFVGNPQNMIVGSLSKLPFHSFFAVLAPVGLVCLAINRLLLPRFYSLRPLATASDIRQAEWLETPFDDADELPADFRYTLVPSVRRSLLIKCLICLGIAVAGFFAGFNIAWTALVAVTLLLVVAGWEPRLAFKQVDWPLLVFFAGLFIVVGGLRQAGVVTRLFDAVRPFLAGGVEHEGWALAALTVVGSNLFSNVPWVLAVSDWIPQFSSPRTAWLILGMASTFAGNLTLIGSVANVLVVEAGRDVARIGFWTYFKYGVVITAVSTAVGTAWVLFVG
jgi:Na+/H+ antiporter NhaD/arsenite permease-like protein